MCTFQRLLVDVKLLESPEWSDLRAKPIHVFGPQHPHSCSIPNRCHTSSAVAHYRSLVLETQFYHLLKLSRRLSLGLCSYWADAFYYGQGTDILHLGNDFVPWTRGHMLRPLASIEHAHEPA